MTEARPSNYWISPTALSITLNALDEHNYVQASFQSGSVILCYMQGIEGLGYDNGHNYRRWPITAAPTVFHDRVERYVYAAIPRNATSADDTALIVFPPERIDLYGQTEDGRQLGSEAHFYVYLGGHISASESATGALQARSWISHVDTGTLSTDASRDAGGPTEWYRINTIDDTVTFLKTITAAVFGTISFVAGGIIRKVAEFLSLNDAQDDEVVTPKYLGDREKHVEQKYLRKDKDDSTDHKLTAATVISNGDLDVFGNSVLRSGFVSKGNADFGTYNKGISGARIDNQGNGEMGNLVLRESLVVPQITYNRTEVIAGNTWRTKGGGVIDRVFPIAGFDLQCYIKLKLEDGEIGMIHTDDLCQGVFHRTSGNATDNADEHNGNFRFAGFTTIYFCIDEIYGATNMPAGLLAQMTNEEKQSIGENQYAKVHIRKDEDASWADATLPQPQMNFAQYANKSVADRQQSAYDATDYHIYLVGMTSWTYGSTNIIYIEGNLNGFSIDCRYWDPATRSFVDGTKQLSGYGLAFGKAYQWGNIEQFDRAPSLVSQQLYYLANNSTTAPGKPDTTAGWTTTPQYASDTKIYLWQCWKFVYSDNSTTYGDVFRAANYSKDGKPGTSINIKGSSEGFYSDYNAFNAALVAGSLTNGLYLVNYNNTPRLYTVTGKTATFTSPTAGDCYVNRPDGHLFSAGDNGWTDAGSIQGTSVIAQYSSDLTNWHATYADGDIWMRTSADSGDTWTPAMRIVGERGVPGTDGKPGADGKPGKDGQNSLTIDFDNEILGIPMTHDGHTAGCVYRTTLTAYFGTSQVAITGISQMSMPQGVRVATSVSGGRYTFTITIPEGITLIDDKGIISVTATTAYGNRTADINLVGQRAGETGANAVAYELTPDASHIKLSKEGVYSETTLICSVSKREGDVITHDVKYGSIYVVLDEISNDFLLDNGDAITFDDGATTIGGAELIPYPESGFVIGTTYNPQVCVKFVLFAPDGRVLDIENVLVVIDGKDGKSFGGIEELYYASASKDASTLPAHTATSHSAWSNVIPTDFGKEKPYLWNFEIITTKDAISGDTTEVSAPAIVSTFAKDGRGIVSIVEEYFAKTTDTAPSASTSGSATPTAAGYGKDKPYLFNRETTNYTEGDPDTTAWALISHWGQDGTSVKAQYSADGKTAWHDDFTAADYYMRTSTDSGVTWSPAVQIKGESAPGADYVDYSYAVSAYGTTSRPTNKPTDTPAADAWSDVPVVTTSTKPYLWCQHVIMQWNETTRGHDRGTPQFFRLTGEVGAKGDTGSQGPKGDKGDTGAQGQKGDKGDQGDQGAKGDKGDKGDTGAQGPAGADAYTADLTNEMDSVPMDYNGMVQGPVVLTTQLRVLRGSTPVTLVDMDYERAPSGVSVDCDETTGLATITINNLTELDDDRCVIRLYGYYTDAKGASRAAVCDFTIQGVRCGDDGIPGMRKYIQANTPVVQVTTRPDGSHAWSHPVVYAYRYAVSGNGNPVAASDGYLFYHTDVMGQDEEGKDIYRRYSLMGVTVRNTDIHTVTFEWRSSTAATGYVVWDRETVPVLFDGAVGPQGPQGPGISIEGAADEFRETITNIMTSVLPAGTYITNKFGTSATGSYVWTKLPGGTMTEPVIADSGTIYSCKADGHLYAAGTTNEGWKDMGELAGADAEFFLLQMQPSVGEGATRIPFSIMHVKGDLQEELSYATAVGYNLSAGGPSVVFNATGMYINIPSGTTKDNTHTVYLYRDNVLINSATCVVIGNGERGFDGCIVRRSEWMEGKEYRNDSAGDTTAADGNRYIDEVSLYDANSGQSHNFVCQSTHQSTPSNRPNPSQQQTQYWVQMNNLAPFKTPFADMKEAVIGTLNTEQIILTRSYLGSTQVYGAFGGGANVMYPLWFGGQNPTSAVFKVGVDGKLYCSAADITGKVSATSGSIGGWNLNTNALVSPNGRFTLDAQNGKIELVSADGKQKIVIDSSTMGIRFFDKANGSTFQECGQFNFDGLGGAHITLQTDQYGTMKIGGGQITMERGSSVVALDIDDASLLLGHGGVSGYLDAQALHDLLNPSDGVWSELQNLKRRVKNLEDRFDIPSS